jgi:uncharacterized protein YjaG (DUF416 family)
MALPAFSENEVLQALSTISIKGQRAFGALCCERLFPNYVAFQSEAQWGRPELLRQALDTVWLDLSGQVISLDEVRRLVEECEFVAPHSDDFDYLRVTSAQDACFAICSLLEHVLNPEPEMIVRIATYATDSVDLFVQEIENMKPNAPNLEEMILAHPLMQQELVRQAHDLEAVRQALAGEDSLPSLDALRRNDEIGNLNLSST